VKFRRQHPIGPFIADFYCAEHKLVVEIDGEIHELQIEQDQTRTKQFEDYGYKLLRFHNQQVEKDLESVLRTILESCNRDPQA
jgi:very-short-patch-repair endonuclease